MQYLPTMIIATACTTLGACSPMLTTPAARLTHASPAATIREDGHALEGRAGVGFENASHISGEVQHRYGVTEQLETNFNVQYRFVEDNAKFDLDSPHQLSLSAGLKHELGTPHLAASVNLGLGFSPFATSAGADATLHLSYDNPYLVPFLTGRVGVSAPIDAPTLEVGEDPEFEGQLHQVHPSLLWSAATGVRLRTRSFSGVPLHFDLAATLGASQARDSHNAGSAKRGLGFGSVSLLVGYEFE